MGDVLNDLRTDMLAADECVNKVMKVVVCAVSIEHVTYNRNGIAISTEQEATDVLFGVVGVGSRVYGLDEGCTSSRCEIS